MKTMSCECGKQVRVGDDCVSVKCSICVINEHTRHEPEAPRVSVDNLIEGENNVAA